MKIKPQDSVTIIDTGEGDALRWKFSVRLVKLIAVGQTARLISLRLSIWMLLVGIGLL